LLKNIHNSINEGNKQLLIKDHEILHVKTANNKVLNQNRHLRSKNEEIQIEVNNLIEKLKFFKNQNDDLNKVKQTYLILKDN